MRKLMTCLGVVLTLTTVLAACESDIVGGPPGIAFTHVPPRGSSQNLEGEVMHVTPADYRVAVYILVGSGWWTKPTFASPLTVIDDDGTFVTDITTGGIDQTASAVAAFLVPAEYAPPRAGGLGSLPAELEQNALASVQVER